MSEKPNTDFLAQPPLFVALPEIFHIARKRNVLAILWHKNHDNLMKQKGVTKVCAKTTYGGKSLLECCYFTSIHITIEILIPLLVDSASIP